MVQIFNSIVELIIFVGISTKRATAEMEIHPVTTKTKARKCSIWSRANLFVLLTHQIILVYLMK